MNKCNIQIKTKSAYLNNKEIYIDDYIKNYKKDKNIKCCNGHDLILADGTKNIAYFRHKHANDMIDEPLSEWHSEWQSNFLITERTFKKINDKQIKDRRADVLLEEHNLIIEFQHSDMDKEEVDNRKNDYEQHKLNILWVIDGNQHIIVNKKLINSGRIYLEFNNKKWKFFSFTSYNIIFIDINNEIYKLNPNDVKSFMIDVEKPYKKEEFIKFLKNNDPVLYDIPKTTQCNLILKQLGAGNGKTYGMIMDLDDGKLSNYKHLIMVTKQHSAKTVIYSEFENLKSKFINIKNINQEEINKKYIIRYENTKTKQKCILIIATVDSLMFNLGSSDNNYVDKFEGIVNSIIDNGIKTLYNNILKYGNICLKVNKECCMVIDETQDLTIDYAKALHRVMRDWYIDCYAVGDKLQSIVHENNALTYFLDNDISHIKKDLIPKSNICRRFTNNDLITFVNDIVPFNNYELPKIVNQVNKNIIQDENDKKIVIIKGELIRDEGKDEEKQNKFNEEVEKIMNYYKKEVENNKMKANDFLIITPFTTKNPLMNALETAIQKYWIDINNGSVYEKYAVFHKSESGTINLDESKNATRMVSIHTSKGDGRKIVFVIGLDEQSLIKFSGKKNNLIYDSLIHVAFTRMKEKLYIRIVDNGDDISQKISKYAIINNIGVDIKPYIDIKKRNNFSNIKRFLDNDTFFSSLKTEIIDKRGYKFEEREEDEKQIVDITHHYIRYSSMLIFLYVKILKHENQRKKEGETNIKRQICAKFIEIQNAEIKNTDKWQDHYKLLGENYNNNSKDIKNKNYSDKSIKNISILEFNKCGKDYKKYFEIINNFVKDLQKKIRNIDKIDLLCPLESIIVFYMMQICQNGLYSDITINELYNIVDIYYKTFNYNMEGHEKCICKKEFIDNKNCNNNISKYLSKHYEYISNIGQIYDTFLSKNPKVNWLIEQKINYSGNNDKDFEIYQKYGLIGYNDTEVFIVYLKPQYNQLNFNFTMIDSIYDTFLLTKINNNNNENNLQNEKHAEKIKKFSNKKIITNVFSLDKNCYYEYDWKKIIEENNNMLIKNIGNVLTNKYKIESEFLYLYFKFKFDKNISTKQNEIINNIINDIKNNNINDKFPPFIIKFFENIKVRIKNKQNKLKLKNYLDRDFFMGELCEIIEENINDFLGIEIKDENEDEDEDEVEDEDYSENE